MLLIPRLFEKSLLLFIAYLPTLSQPTRTKCNMKVECSHIKTLGARGGAAVG